MAAALQAALGQVRSVTPKIKHILTNAQARLLEVTWQDGTRGRYPFVWLRDNCPAPHTYKITPTLRARQMLMLDLDANVTPDQVALDPSGQTINIRWPGDLPSEYTSNWLWQRNLDNASVRDSRRSFEINQVVTWDAADIQKNLVKISWNDLMNNEHKLLDGLRALCKYGIVMIDKAPDVNACADLGEHIMGFTYATHYNLPRNRTIDHVKFRPVAGNLQYTANALGLHTDLPQFGMPPETQMLHLVKKATHGGVSLFADGFRVAEQLRREKPSVFRLLANTDIEYVDHGKSDIDYHMRAKWPVIRLNTSDQVEGVYFNNQMRSWFYNVAVEEIQTVYNALKTFNDYAYEPRNLLEIALDEGQIMWFANNRVLHGRSAFEVLPGKTDGRHMANLFINWDAIKSKIRILEEKLDDTDS